MRLKKHVLLLMSTSLLYACGSGGLNSAEPQYVAHDFTLQDAVDVYQCAYDKETEPALKEELQKGLFLHKLFQGDEATFKAEADPTRGLRQANLNQIAVKYQCPPGH